MWFDWKLCNGSNPFSVIEDVSSLLKNIIYLPLMFLHGSVLDPEFSRSILWKPRWLIKVKDGLRKESMTNTLDLNKTYNKLLEIGKKKYGEYFRLDKMLNVEINVQSIHGSGTKSTIYTCKWYKK